MRIGEGRPGDVVARPVVRECDYSQAGGLAAGVLVAMIRLLRGDHIDLAGAELRIFERLPCDIRIKHAGVNRLSLRAPLREE